MLATTWFRILLNVFATESCPIAMELMNRLLIKRSNPSDSVWLRLLMLLQTPEANSFLTFAIEKSSGRILMSGTNLRV